jgi:hypothetical protein
MNYNIVEEARELAEWSKESEALVRSAWLSRCGRTSKSMENLAFTSLERFRCP